MTRMGPRMHCTETQPTRNACKRNAFYGVDGPATAMVPQGPANRSALTSARKGSLRASAECGENPSMQVQLGHA
eukprot:202987-Alexandrium_andersonii.AAC.1